MSLPKPQHPYSCEIVIYICRELKIYTKLWFFCFIAFLVTFNSREKVHKFPPYPPISWLQKQKSNVNGHVCGINFPWIIWLTFFHSRFSIPLDWVKNFWAHRKTFQFSQQKKNSLNSSYSFHLHKVKLNLIFLF